MDDLNVTIRRYQEKDREQLISLILDLEKSLCPLNPIRRQEPAPEYGQKYLDSVYERINSGHGHIYVAERDEKVIGFSIGLIKEYSCNELMLFKPGKEGNITEIYVIPEYRDQGIGRRLIEELENYFKEEGCEYAVLGLLANNKHAYNLYINSGYSDRFIKMAKKINNS